MKKSFDFGYIDYEGRGKALNRVTVDMEYKEENGKKRFSVSASVWNSRHSDIIAGGQCLDTIAPYINDPVYNKILRLWKLYHLNDMHPECEHQATAGWRDKAVKKVNLYKFTMTTEAMYEQHKIENAVIQAAKDGENLRLSKEKRTVLSLDYSITTPDDTLPENLAPYYKLKETEVKALGWLKETEHPNGILSKPCPVCGYKYGSSWVYFPIPENDEKIIIELLGGVI